MQQSTWLIHPEHGVYFLTPPLESFEQSYTAVRNKEGRILTDEEVQRLPQSSTYAEEWEKRSWTALRFVSYVKKRGFQSVLEIGCGNGWFSALLSKDCSEVIGLDVGRLELEQAARCFPKAGLHYVCCSDWSLLPAQHFDCIVFNGSAHYFEPDGQFWESLYRILKPGGEIHLLDSNIYGREALQAAKQRSADYFSQLGETNAAAYYHHLTWDRLPANHDVLYRPSRFLNKLFSQRSPFPRIRIQRPS